MTGLVALAAILGGTLLVPALAPDAWLQVDLSSARQAPDLAHWFGTDNAGRDLFVRIAQGLRMSLVLAVACAAASTFLGMLVGAVAAVLGGWVDGVLMRLADVTNALPHLLLGIVVVAFHPGSMAAIVGSLALTHWPQVARLVRSVAITTREMEFVEADYLSGASHAQVARRHLLPAGLGQALVALVLLLPHAIWHESTLSFLGLGLSPDRPSLGTLLSIARGEVMTGAWWTLVFPSLALVLTTVAVSSSTRLARQRWSPRAESQVA